MKSNTIVISSSSKVIPHISLELWESKEEKAYNTLFKQRCRAMRRAGYEKNKLIPVMYYAGDCRLKFVLIS